MVAETTKPRERPLFAHYVRKPDNSTQPAPQQNPFPPRAVLPNWEEPLLLRNAGYPFLGSVAAPALGLEPGVSFGSSGSSVFVSIY
jgi:hypothetical protein